MFLSVFCFYILVHIVGSQAALTVNHKTHSDTLFAQLAVTSSISVYV